MSWGRKAKPKPLPARNPMAVFAYAPGAAFPLPTGPSGYTAGWKAFPHIHSSQQIGAFDGQLLNQYPANVPGVQLHGGREWGSSSWYYPSLTVIPNGSVQQTTTPNNIAGGQRDGSIYSGPIGPLSARRNAANLAAAQVRQSGAQAMAWAQQL